MTIVAQEYSVLDIYSDIISDGETVSVMSLNQENLTPNKMNVRLIEKHSY